MKSTYIILVIILLVAAAVRLFALGQFPNGFTGDEAQQGYSAYSILKTGKDEWGQTLPLFPRGFGDFKPPLYTYLTIPSVALFGLSVEAVRFPAAIVGILLIVVVFFLSQELFKNEKIALWSSFILAINPWHVQLSRTAFEGGVGILTFSLGLYFYLKSGLKNLTLASTFWGLTFYTYHSFRVFVALFIVGLIIINFKKIINIRNWGPVLILLIFILPLVLNINSTLARSSDVGIYRENQISGYFVSKGTSPLPPIVDRLFDNKVLFVFNEFIGNYLSYYSPTFFFSDDRPDNTYLNFPYFPLVFPIEIIIWLLGIYSLITQREKSMNIIFLWLILAAVPAALATGAMNAGRAPTFLPLIVVLTAIGVKIITNRFKSLNPYIITIFLINFSIFLNFYFIKLPQKPPDNLRYGYDLTFKKILEVEKNYNEIVISKAFTEPQIFIAFYSKMDSLEFQNASQNWLRYEQSGKLYVDQLESYNLGKFLFEDVNWDRKDALRKNALIVSKTEDFPQDVQSLLDVRDPKGRIIYRLVPISHE